MAAIIPVGNARYLTELDIRIWLRDNDPAANLLLDDYEFSTEEIRTAMTLTVDYWNDQPPFIGTFDVNAFPFRGAYLRGTCANLLFMAANRYRRNDLQYNVPGGAINDQARHKEYDAAGDRLWEEYKKWVMLTKRAINIENGWGEIW